MHPLEFEEIMLDCALIFSTCSLLQETSEVGKAGKIVQSFFDRLVDNHMPEYSSYARRHESPDIPESRVESERKKRKTTPPPHSNNLTHGESTVHIH